MQFDTGTLTRCAGGNHYKLPIVIGGATKTLEFTKDDLEGEPPATVAEARLDILTRLRSAAKEAGATTFSQTKTAIENKTNFRV